MTSALPVAQSSRDGATILTPVGDIDMSRAPAVRQALNNAMRERPARLVIDLTKVPYVDSSGIATLIEALQMTIKGKSKLVLVGVSPKVQSAFEITKLVGMFTIAPSVDAAVVA